MYIFKKHITLVFIFTLLLPLAIQVAHAFENHEHTVCKSITEKHIHEKDFECSDLHQILETYSTGISANYAVIPTHYYIENFNEQPQQVKVVCLTKKS